MILHCATHSQQSQQGLHLHTTTRSSHTYPSDSSRNTHSKWKIHIKTCLAAVRMCASQEKSDLSNLKTVGPLILGWFHRITKTFMLEKISKTIESNHDSALPRPPLDHVPRCHIFGGTVNIPAYALFTPLEKKARVENYEDHLYYKIPSKMQYCTSLHVPESFTGFSFLPISGATVKTFLRKHREELTIKD